MSLTFDERLELTERLTVAASRSPRAYAARVVSWILLGYLILMGLTAIAIVLSAGVLTLIVATRAFALLQIAWIPLVFVWLLTRSLFVRVEPPQGRVIRSHEAPQLFSMIEDIRRRLDVKPMEGVLIIPELNAAVVEVPRFGGLFGWRPYLLIGLPLMLTHSTEELRAVLAHEMGHLSGRHGRLGAWVWRVRMSWARLSESVGHRRDLIARGLSRLLDWYVSRLMVTTLVQARAQEFAADRSSMELTDGETAARALARSVVGSRLLDERLWDPIWKRVETEPVPSVGPMDELRRRRDEILAEPWGEILDKEMARDTSGDDSHPSLRDRLARLGHTTASLSSTDPAAAEDLNGKLLDRLVGEFDRNWRREVLHAWEERHEALVETARKLALLDSGETESAEPMSRSERARLLEQLGRTEEVFPLLEQEALERPEDPETAFAYGRALLEKGELRGLDYFVTAMKRDWRSVAPACEIAYGVLRDQGRHREAEAWAERYRQQMELLDRAQEQMNTLRASDLLEPSQLSEDHKEALIASGREAGWIGHMWIARKGLHDLDFSSEIVVVRARWFRFSGAKKLQALAEASPVDVPLLYFEVQDGATIRRLNRIPGARVL